MRSSFQQQDDKTLNKLFLEYPTDLFKVTHHCYQLLLLKCASQDDITISQLKDIEELVFPYFKQQEYYSLILYYAPLWAKLYEERHSYKQASICFKHAFNASEKVRQRMSS